MRKKEILGGKQCLQAVKQVIKSEEEPLRAEGGGSTNHCNGSSLSQSPGYFISTHATILPHICRKTFVKVFGFAAIFQPPRFPGKQCRCVGVTALRNNHGNKITISDDKQRQSNVPWWSHYTPLPVDVVRATLGELLISFNTSASQKKVIGILKQDFQGLHKMKCVSR